MSVIGKHLYQFGMFVADTDQRVVLREGKPLPLAPKLFETLLILVEHSGRIVSKDELLSRLWPDTFVEDSNLTFNIQQLRKALGDNARNPVYIETVARRGYRFIAGVEDVSDDGSFYDSHFERRFSETELGHEWQRPFNAGQNPDRMEGDCLETDRPFARASEEAVRDSPPASSRVTAWRLTLGIMLIIAAGLMFWRAYGRSALNANERAAGRLIAPPHLNFEKLTATGQSGYAAISPDGKYVAYTRIFDRKTGIWLRQLATNTNIEIVPATSVIYSLAFSNSGEYLYFARGDATPSLYRVSLVGGVPQRIVDRVEGNFAISTDDSRLAFVRAFMNTGGQKEYSLNLVNSDGGNEQPLIKTKYPNAIDVPLWSTDDKSIIFSSGYSEGGGQDVRIVDVSVEDGTTRVLSDFKFFKIRKMAWLPDHSAMIICARKNLEDNNQLWRVSYPKFEIVQLTEELSPFLDLSISAPSGKAVATQATRASDIWAGPSTNPRNLTRITQATGEFCWTPTGRLVYPSTASANGDLWITQSDNTEQRQLTNDPALDKTPAVTVGNRYIVFTTNRTGSFQLWRMNVDGSDQVQLTNRAPADHPSITPDGKWILYNTTEDWHIWKISIDGGAPIALIEHPAYFPAISPDGKMIACLERTEPKSALSISVIPFNGGAAVKRIDFAGGGFSGSRIQWTPDGNALLYAIERNGPTVLVKQKLDGGPPEEIMDFGGDELFDFGYSPDGKLLAVTRGVWQHDVVFIADFGRR
jgi:eukaryotic-like serine/threonine-protein kinase